MSETESVVTILLGLVMVIVGLAWAQSTTPRFSGPWRVLDNAIGVFALLALIDIVLLVASVAVRTPV